MALVTGGNRGLGLETCRQLGALGYRVLLTSRHAGQGDAAAESLRAGGADVTAIALDVTDAAAVRRAVKQARARLGRVDVLVNNAAIDPEDQGSVLDIDAALVRRVIETNVYGALLMCQVFVPSMVGAGYGRVVNVSSRSGQLASMTDDEPAYRISKAALNAVTRLVADATAGTNVLVNSVCPGWVRTDMGGPHAPRSVEQGADSIVWLATLPDGGPTGGFFRDQKRIEW